MGGDSFGSTVQPPTRRGVGTSRHVLSGTLPEPCLSDSWSSLTEVFLTPNEDF